MHHGGTVPAIYVYQLHMFKACCPQGEKLFANQITLQFFGWCTCITSEVQYLARVCCAKNDQSPRVIGPNCQASRLASTPAGCRKMKRQTHVKLTLKSNSTQNLTHATLVSNQWTLFCRFLFQKMKVLFVFPNAIHDIRHKKGPKGAPLGRARGYPRTCGPRVHGPAGCPHGLWRTSSYTCPPWLADVRWKWWLFHAWSLSYKVTSQQT